MSIPNANTCPHCGQHYGYASERLRVCWTCNYWPDGGSP